jgi:hypothetical protein
MIMALNAILLDHEQGTTVLYPGVLYLSQTHGHIEDKQDHLNRGFPPHDCLV